MASADDRTKILPRLQDSGTPGPLKDANVPDKTQTVAIPRVIKTIQGHTFKNVDCNS